MISQIEIAPEWLDALRGIEDYSHLFVVFWMHKVERGSVQRLVHPRGDQSLDKTGIFASRMRNRPNPIGLAVVELIDVDGCRLTVKKLDALDGTPVLDLKPYDDYDVVEDVTVPEWWAKRCRQ